MKIPKFAHLVVKPTLACTARCKTCSTRKMLHKLKIEEDQLDITDWKRLFSEVNDLGLSKLTISGGEPTLYKDLMELITEGKKYDWEIGLSTNGSLISREYATRLKNAGLDAVILSVYSPQAEFHDSIRNHPGLWGKAVNAAKIFADIRDREDQNFRIHMQTILCKGNYGDFPDLIRLAYELRFCGITFSYLEGDFQEQIYLLDENQIREFKHDIVPEVVDIIQKSSGSTWTRKMAVSAVRSIFPVGKLTERDYALGMYRHPKPCEIPSFFSIILANGDVHPCNIVEYTHYPVVGNLREKTFTEIWGGEEWSTFRKSGFDLCRYCPVPHQVYIPIMRRPEFVQVQYILKNTFLKSLYLSVKRVIFSRRKLFTLIRTRG